MVFISKNYFDNYYEATATRKKLKKSKKNSIKIPVKLYRLPSSFYPFKVEFLKFAKWI